MSKIYVIGAGVKGHEEFGRRALEMILANNTAAVLRILESAAAGVPV